MPRYHQGLPDDLLAATSSTPLLEGLAFRYPLEMSHLAAILVAHNAPLELVRLDHVMTDHNGGHCSYGQVKVQVIASGICGAQLGEQAGHRHPDSPMPRLLGHEGVGVIKETGPGVNVQLRGKKCILHWRVGDGPQAVLPASYTAFGKTYSGGHICTFTESAVVSANRVTAVPDGTPDEICVLLGCSLSTALGTIEQEAKLRLGETVLILGCGGVGLSLILAASAAGAGHITVVDKEDEKGHLALQAGAESFCSIKLIQELGRRYDVIIDTTGCAEVIEQTIPLLSGTGRYVLLGQTRPGEDFKIKSAVDRFHGEGSHLIWSQGGGFKPSQMIPRYLRLWDSGRLKLDALISHRLPLSRINEGMDLVRAGQAGRVLIEMKK